MFGLKSRLVSLKNKLWPLPTVKQEDQNPKKENSMFDSILGAIKDEAGFAHKASILNTVNQLIAHFGDNYVKDGNAKDAALDSLCQLLISLKSKPAGQ